MPRGFRIVKSTHSANAFDGEGARQYGGRWNSPGTAVVYAAQSESLAALELLVHLQASQLLSSYSTLAVDFEDSLVEVCVASALPSDWNEYPAPTGLQELGDRWVCENRSAILQVPSAVIPTEAIYVLNPNHPDFRRIAIGPPTPFRFDPRLK